MNKQRLILIGAGAAAVVVAAALFVWLTRPEPTALVPEPTISATPSASPAASEAPDVHHGVEEAHQQEGAANPILRALPHQTAYWRLDFDGSQGDRYQLLATVEYVPGKDDPAVKIAEQRPFIEAYVRSTGQPDGTYVIEYEPVSAETEGDA